MPLPRTAPDCELGGVGGLAPRDPSEERLQKRAEKSHTPPPSLTPLPWPPSNPWAAPAPF